MKLSKLPRRSELTRQLERLQDHNNNGLSKAEQHRWAMLEMATAAKVATYGDRTSDIKIHTGAFHATVRPWHVEFVQEGLRIIAADRARANRRAGKVGP